MRGQGFRPCTAKGSLIASTASTRAAHVAAEVRGWAWRLPSGRSRPTGGGCRSRAADPDRCFASRCHRSEERYRHDALDVPCVPDPGRRVSGATGAPTRRRFCLRARRRQERHCDGVLQPARARARPPYRATFRGTDPQAELSVAALAACEPMAWKFLKEPKAISEATSPARRIFSRRMLLPAPPPLQQGATGTSAGRQGVCGDTRRDSAPRGAVCSRTGQARSATAPAQRW